MCAYSVLPLHAWVELNMTPFFPSELPPEYYHPAAYMSKFGVDLEEALKMVRRVMSDDIFLNDTYQVNRSQVHRNLDDGWPDMIHLSIKRIDKEPIRDWADMQQIKNELIGPENEGIEIFPAESRLVDMANQYHIWCFADPTVRIPIGWTNRMVGTSEQAEAVGAKQRERKVA